MQEICKLVPDWQIKTAKEDLEILGFGSKSIELIGVWLK